MLIFYLALGCTPKDPVATPVSLNTTEHPTYPIYPVYPLYPYEPTHSMYFTEQLPLPILHKAKDFGCLPRLSDESPEHDQSPAPEKEKLPFRQLPQSPAKISDLKENIQEQKQRWSGSVDSHPDDPEFEIKWKNSTPKLYVRAVNKGQLFVSPLAILPAGTQMYTWTDENIASHFDRIGAVPPNELSKILEATNPEQLQGNGVYASSNPFDSATFGNSLMITTLRSDLLIAYTKAIRGEPKFWSPAWNALPKNKLILHIDAVNRGLRHAGVHGLSDAADYGSLGGWFVFFHPEALQFVQSQSHPWLAGTTHSFTKFIRGGTLSADEKKELEHKIPAILDQVVVEPQHKYSVGTAHVIRALSRNFPDLLFQRFQKYVAKNPSLVHPTNEEETSQREKFLKRFNSLLLEGEDLATKLFQPQTMNCAHENLANTYLTCKGTSKTNSECELQKKYLQLSKSLKKQGVHHPEKMIDILVPRFFDSKTWRTAESSKADKNFPLKFYGEPNWVSWEKGADLVQTLIADPAFQLRSVISPSFLNTLHSQCYGDDCTIRSTFRNESITANMDTRSQALTESQIDSLHQFTAEFSDHHSRPWINWEPVLCYEDSPHNVIGKTRHNLPKIEKNIFFDDHGTSKQCGILRYGPQGRPAELAAHVVAAMGQWSKQFLKHLEETEAGTLDPIWFASWAQRQYVAIHPFEDGNGRTSRFVMDLILGKFGFPAPILDDMDNDLFAKSDDEWACEIATGLHNTMSVLENCDHNPQQLSCKVLNWSKSPN